VFLVRNGFHLTASNPDLEALAIAVAQSKTTIEAIASWLREHSVLME
jgi:prophage maintenance system killer protein